MTVPPTARLLGDIGGTHARFARQAGPGAPPTQVVTYVCAAHDSLQNAISHYLREQGGDLPLACAIGIANPITGDQVQMTNLHWSFSIAELQRELGLERLVVINDFSALALALPHLAPADLRRLGGGIALPTMPMALLGPGTGLGVSGLIPTGLDSFTPINGEGGHVSLAADSDREAAVIDRLRQRFGHASAERALSGPGLTYLYEAICALADRAATDLSPAEVVARALGRSDPQCGEALSLFCNFLGAVAGDLALTLGARGGVYIGGGIAPRILGELERSSFRERFESKGRFRDYLRNIATFVIDAELSPSLVGAGRALDMTN